MAHEPPAPLSHIALGRPVHVPLRIETGEPDWDAATHDDLLRDETMQDLASRLHTQEP